MKNDCSIVQDLLPLYAEDMVKPETREFVDGHLADCAACRAELDALRAEETPSAPAIQLAPLRGIERALRRRRLTAVLLTAALVLTLATAGFAYVTAPQYMAYDETAWFMTRTPRSPQGSIMADGLQSFAGVSRVDILLTTPVSGTAVSSTYDENGKILYFISAWRTPLDEWLGKFAETDDVLTARTAAETLCAEQNAVEDTLREAEAAVNTLRSGDGVSHAGNSFLTFDTENCAGIYYSPNNGQEDVLLCGPRTDGGIVSLPRLALGYYALLALALGAALGLAWLVCRKRPCGGTLGRLALVPLCYLAGHVLVKGFATTSYQMQRDLALIVLAGALLYGAVLLALDLRTQKRSGK